MNRLLFSGFPLFRAGLWVVVAGLFALSSLVGEPVLLGSALGMWVVGSSLIRVEGLQLLGGRLTITLERDELLLRAVKGSRVCELHVPRSSVPRLDYKGLDEVDLCWAAPSPVRFPLGGVARAQREAFEVWRSGDLAPALRSRIEINPAPSARICPLCHDVIGAQPEGRCSDCETVYHWECWSELGGCALPSCRSLMVPLGAHPVATSRFLREPDSRPA